MSKYSLLSNRDVERTKVGTGVGACACAGAGTDTGSGLGATISCFLVLGKNTGLRAGLGFSCCSFFSSTGTIFFYFTSISTGL
jgi:hypothetical protein